MSSILYYSNFCKHSKDLLNKLAKTQSAEKIHFVCIDNREVQQDGGIHIILENNDRLLLPPTIKNVPSLLLLNHGNRVLSGNNEILHFIKPGEIEIKRAATNFNGEPLAFSFSEMGSSMSDTYSYLDMSAEELSAKGNGGLRQKHSFMTINENPTIETPPDDYVPNKVGSVDLGQLQAQRDNEITRHR